MKLVEIRDADPVEFYVKLTTDEEQDLATWVMDLLSKRWLSATSPGCSELYKLVRKIYYYKCYTGKDLHATTYEELTNLINTWNRQEWECPSDISQEEFEEIVRQYQIPTEVLDPEDDDKCHQAPLMDASGATYTKEERIRLYCKEKRNLWRNVWREHRALKGSSEAFLVFPGDDPGQGHRRVQQDKERRFWDEVERRKTEWEVSRKEAEKLVADYMPRGDMSLSDRSELEPPKSITDAMEFEIPEGDGDLSDFDYYFPETDPESDHF